MARHSTARPAGVKKLRFQSQTSSLRRADTRNATPVRQMCRLERRDREITQPQFSEPAFFPQPEQRPIECLPQQIIAASNRYTDAFAKKATLKIRTPSKHAAICGIRTIEPKSE